MFRPWAIPESTIYTHKQEDKGARLFVVGGLPAIEVDKVCGHIFFFPPIISPQDSMPWIPDSNVLDSKFFVSGSWIRDPLSCIPDF